MHKVFIINLDAQPARWAFMEKQFSILGMDVERIQAVNGYDKNNPRYAPVAPYSFLPDGEVGCFESHRKAWKKVIEDNLSGAFILEDDVAVSSDFKNLKDEIVSLDKVDVVKIDTCSWASNYGDVVARTRDNRELRKLMGSETSAGCYYVTKAGAKKLLDKTINYFEPVDTMMFNLSSKLFYEINTLKVYPAAAAQLRYYMKKNEMPPEISNSMQEKRRLGIDPRNRMSLLKNLQLYCRRLKDWDFSAVRKRRQDNYLENNPPAIISEIVKFYTESCAHIDQAAVLLE